MPHPTALAPSRSAVLVIDVQEKLMPKILRAEELVRNMAFLIDAARLADVEVLATEQYPRGLGPTVPELAKRLPPPPDKLAFSSCAVPGLIEGLSSRGKSQIVLAGIESHVCVLNTALDLLAAKMQVILCVDALGSRFAVDHETALRRLEQAGAMPATVEMVGFEWIGGAQHPRFKDYSLLVQERMKHMA